MPCALCFLGLNPSMLNEPEPEPELAPLCTVGWVEDGNWTSLDLLLLTLNLASSTLACIFKR